MLCRKSICGVERPGLGRTMAGILPKGRFMRCDRREAQRGATIVEFTLAFMLFLLVVLGLMELGRATWTYATITHATRQAGRYCVVHGSINTASLSEIRVVVEKHTIGLESSELQLETIWNPGTAAETTNPADVERGDTAQVIVTYPFRLVTGGLIVDASTIRMGSETRVVVVN